MGNEMMNRFLGIALEMVFNRHRRREILFWWLYFFLLLTFFVVFFSLFSLIWFYSILWERAIQEERRKGSSSGEHIGNSIHLYIWPFAVFNCKHCDPATTNISLPANAFSQTTLVNDIQQLLLLIT